MEGRQKTLLGVLAVMCVAAGSYFLYFKPAANDTGAIRTGPTARATRATGTATTNARVTRKTTKSSAASKARAKRTVRVAKKTERAKRGVGKRAIKKKKKKLAPAA